MSDDIKVVVSDGKPRRHCGDCSLCCKLLPMQSGADRQGRRPEALAMAVAVGMAVPGIPDFEKPAGERCPHQRHGKGCAVYKRRPFGCQIWNCRWLVADDTADLRRPDRAGYVIDLMPDFVTLVDNATGGKRNVQVVVIWVDRSEAWRHDRALSDYMLRRGAQGIATMVRFNERDAATIFPPNMADDGLWHEWPRGQAQAVPQHTDATLLAGLADCRPLRLKVQS